MAEQRYIWIHPATEVRWLWKPLAEELFARTGSIPVLLVATEADRRFYLSQFGRLHAGQIVVRPDIYSMTVTGDWPLTVEEARDSLARFEREYGVGFYREMLPVDRQLGRAYLLGAEGFPASRTSQAATPDAIVRAGGVLTQFFEELARKYPPALVICMSGGVGLYGKPMAAVARKSGALFRNLMHTRFSFRYYWSEDELGESEWLRKRLLAEPEPDSEAVERVLNELRPTGDFEFYVDRMRREGRVMLMFAVLVKNALKHLRARLTGSRKAKIGYSMIGEMSMIVRARRHRRMLSDESRPMLRDLPESRRLVFFPLQVEPEISLHGLAPNFLDQCNTAVQLSRNLPADALLVIKEHPAQFGRRDDGFYHHLMSLPNAVLISDRESSYPIIRRAALIVAVTSSAAHEAAVLGRPTVYLSHAGPIHTVPHVTHLPDVSAFSRIPSLLEEACSGNDMNRRIAGAKYFIGLLRNAVPFDSIGTDMFDRDREPTLAEIGAIADSLVATFPSGSLFSVRE